MCRWQMYFVLSIMPDKAAYMSAVLLCVQLLPEKMLYLLLKRHLMAESEFTFPVLRSDRCEYPAMFLCSKHRAVHVKEAF